MDEYRTIDNLEWGGCEEECQEPPYIGRQSRLSYSSASIP